MAERAAVELAEHRLVVGLLHGGRMLRALPLGMLALVALGAGCGADKCAVSTGADVASLGLACAMTRFARTWPTARNISP